MCPEQSIGTESHTIDGIHRIGCIPWTALRAPSPRANHLCIPRRIAQRKRTSPPPPPGIASLPQSLERPRIRMRGFDGYWYIIPNSSCSFFFSLGTPGFFSIIILFRIQSIISISIVLRYFHLASRSEDPTDADCPYTNIGIVYLLYRIYCTIHVFSRRYSLMPLSEGVKTRESRARCRVSRSESSLCTGRTLYVSVTDGVATDSLMRLNINFHFVSRSRGTSPHSSTVGLLCSVAFPRFSELLQFRGDQTQHTPLPRSVIFSSIDATEIVSQFPRAISMTKGVDGGTSERSCRNEQRMPIFTSFVVIYLPSKLPASSNFFYLYRRQIKSIRFL